MAARWLTATPMGKRVLPEENCRYASPFGSASGKSTSALVAPKVAAVPTIRRSNPAVASFSQASSAWGAKAALAPALTIMRLRSAM